jgi:hypothetical protein
MQHIVGLGWEPRAAWHVLATGLLLVDELIKLFLSRRQSPLQA